jgi:hypothetical protein
MHRSKKLFSVVSAVAVVTLFGVAACSSTTATKTGDAGAPDGQAPSSACTTNADCLSQLPSTTPPNCATATCSELAGVCTFTAKDEDGDGHAAYH